MGPSCLQSRGTLVYFSLLGGARNIQLASLFFLQNGLTIHLLPTFHGFRCDSGPRKDKELLMVVSFRHLNFDTFLKRLTMVTMVITE